MKRGLVVVLAMALAAPGCGYNRIQELDERAEQMESNIDAELQRRNDLIPNLVATVDEAARFEQETQTRVAEARAGLTQAQSRMAEALRSEAGSSRRPRRRGGRPGWSSGGEGVDRVDPPIVTSPLACDGCFRRRSGARRPYAARL